MHEMGYCAGVLDAVEERADGRPVARVGVMVGAFHRISPDAFDQSFQMLAEGTIADGATTKVTVVPAQATCLTCNQSFETQDPAPACPQCHSSDVKTEGGEQLILQWVEYADPGSAKPVRDQVGPMNVAEADDGHVHEDN